MEHCTFCGNNTDIQPYQYKLSDESVYEGHICKPCSTFPAHLNPWTIDPIQLFRLHTSDPVHVDPDNRSRVTCHIELLTEAKERKDYSNMLLGLFIYMQTQMRYGYTDLTWTKEYSHDSRTISYTITFYKPNRVHLQSRI